MDDETLGFIRHLDDTWGVNLQQWVASLERSLGTSTERWQGLSTAVTQHYTVTSDLVEAVKDVSQNVERLRGKVLKMEKRFASIEASIQELMGVLCRMSARMEADRFETRRFETSRRVVVELRQTGGEGRLGLLDGRWVADDDVRAGDEQQVEVVDRSDERDEEEEGDGQSEEHDESVNQDGNRYEELLRMRENQRVGEWMIYRSD